MTQTPAFYVDYPLAVLDREEPAGVYLINNADEMRQYILEAAWYLKLENTEEAEAEYGRLESMTTDALIEAHFDQNDELIIPVYTMTKGKD